MQNNFTKSKIIKSINMQRALIMLVSVCVVFYILDPSFLSSANIINILMSVSMEGLILIGMTYLIIMGEIDLSVGAVMSISCACVILFQKYGLIAGVLAGVSVGIIIGLAIGLIVVKLHVASLPATLGVMVLVNSLVYVLTQSTSIWGVDTQFAIIANSTIFGIPVFVFLFVLVVIIFDLILKRTTFAEMCTR